MSEEKLLEWVIGYVGLVEPSSSSSYKEFCQEVRYLKSIQHRKVFSIKYAEFILKVQGEHYAFLSRLGRRKKRLLERIEKLFEL